MNSEIDLRDYTLDGTLDELIKTPARRIDAILHAVEFYEEKAKFYEYMPANKHELLLMLEEIKKEVVKARSHV